MGLVRTGRTGILLPVLICLNAAVLRTESDTALRGRDFVRLGDPGTVTGTLATIGGEWFLKAGDETYELHFGDHRHRAETGINLEEGIEAEVFGFIVEGALGTPSDIAVCTIVIDGDGLRFREDDGTPLWRGRGGGGSQD